MRARRHVRLAPLAPLALGALLAACTSDAPPADATAGNAVDATATDAPGAAPQFTVLVAPAQYAAVADWAAATRLARVAALATATARDDLAAGRGAGIRVAAVADLTTCVECYRLEHPAAGYVVHADGVLGLQYGLTHLLEAHGYRFFHPFAGRAPADPATAVVDPAVFNRDYVPELRERALQLWTLHPTEAQAFWVPGADHLAQALAVLDWVVRNRGNTVYFAALDDIVGDSAAWRPHMRAILAAAHLRGLRVGIGVQLYGGPSSLQHAFTLLPGVGAPAAAQAMRASYHTLLDGVAFDAINLSFGEFRGAALEAFLADTNLARQLLDEVAPRAEMTATVHVGCYPSLQVTYMGQTLLYYLLVQFADPRIVPWVHTVMYETLFDDAGGAYNCADFAGHRAFLLARLAHRQPVGYNPESAYWIAFDNSVPMYLPVYMLSRWRDLAQIRRQAAAQGGDALARHVLFSSGWEWGYWQTDAATLRMGFALPDRWSQPLEDMFAPWGAAGSAAVAQVTALGQAQFDALVTHRLAAYLAGRDALLDAGERAAGIVSQPTRPTFQAVAQMDAAARAIFERDVLGALDALAAATDAARAALPADPGALADPWLAEIRDGIAVDAARAHFVAAVWHAADRFGATHDDGGYLAAARGALADGQAAVAHRHAALHWPEPRSLLAQGANATIYPYGYLYYADTLCYWQRELAQLTALLTGAPDGSPACILLGL